MRADTLGQVLGSAGFNRIEHEFGAAIIRFMKSGGSADRAHTLVNEAAKRMSGAGLIDAALGALAGMPASRQPVEDGGAAEMLPQGQALSSPSSSSNRGGEGLTPDARKCLRTSALPVREPKPQRTPIDFGAASVAIKTKLAQSVLDRIKTSDGRAWGDVGAHELDGMSRDGDLAQAIKSHIGVLSNSQRFKTVRELVNAETFETIRRQVHGA